VDPSGLADTKAPDPGAAPRSTLPATGEVQAKGAFAQQADVAAPTERVADLSAPDAKVETGGLADTKGGDAASGARAAAPEGADAPGEPRDASLDAPEGSKDPDGKVEPDRGGSGNLAEDVLPDEDRFDRTRRRPSGDDPDVPDEPGV
jgi:hypothetical protein